MNSNAERATNVEHLTCRQRPADSRPENWQPSRQRRGFGRLRRRNRGAAAVEFAMVAPVFFLLLFGIIEFGRCILVQQMLTNASREGARQAVLDGATTSDVVAVVNQYLAATMSRTATVQVSPNPPSTAALGAPITVTAQIPFSQVSWLPAPRFLGNATLSATSVMRRETCQ